MEVMTPQGIGGGHGMPTIEKPQLLLICSFLSHHILFVFARRLHLYAGLQTEPHLTLPAWPVPTTEVTSNPSILSLLIEADRRSGAVSVLLSPERLPHETV